MRLHIRDFRWFGQSKVEGYMMIGIFVRGLIPSVGGLSLFFQMGMGVGIVFNL